MITNRVADNDNFEGYLRHHDTPVAVKRGRFFITRMFYKCFQAGGYKCIHGICQSYCTQVVSKIIKLRLSDKTCCDEAYIYSGS